MFKVSLACEPALPFGWAKRSARERVSERQIREGLRKGELATISHKWHSRNQSWLLTGLQSATKWVETLRPKWTFWRFPDFKRGKDSVSSPIPSMQCCATVRATFRKQETSQLWMEGTGEGCGFLCFRSYPIWVQCLNNFVADCSWRDPNFCRKCRNTMLFIAKTCVMPVITEFTGTLTHSLRKKRWAEEENRFLLLWEITVVCMSNLVLRGIILQPRTYFSPQSRRACLMWFSQSCMCESVGLP